MNNYLQGILQAEDLFYSSEEEKYYDDIALANLSEGQPVTVTLESLQFATQLELLQADDLSQLQTQTGQGTAQLTFTVQPGTNYVLRITSQNFQETGAYTLTTSAGILNPVLPYQAESLSQQGQYRWQAPGLLGKPITLTYSFMEELPSYYKPNQKGQWDDDGLIGNFQPMTQVQRKAVKLALQEWAKVSGITFKAVADRRSVQLRFGVAEDLSEQDSSSITAGWAHLPIDAPLINGDLWLNHKDSSNRNPVPGSFGFSTILHEIGHTLGLSHPFDDRATLPKAKQTIQYTVMAYDKHPYLPERYQPRTPMLYDIAAIQQLYGKNNKTGRGDTVYRWKPGATFIETLYDTSGTDTIDARNQRQNVVINLEPGTFSSIGRLRAKPIQDNVAIAFGVTLENAFGGSGNDTLIGNSIDNRLIGSAGADVLTGFAGNDTLTGATGADTFVFQTENDGVDTITDFTLGEDIIDVSLLLKQVGYGGTNPFLDGVLTASLQQGSTVISLDRDGFGGIAAAAPLAILENFTTPQQLSQVMPTLSLRAL